MLFLNASIYKLSGIGRACHSRHVLQQSIAIIITFYPTVQKCDACVWRVLNWLELFQNLACVYACAVLNSCDIVVVSYFVSYVLPFIPFHPIPKQSVNICYRYSLMKHIYTWNYSNQIFMVINKVIRYPWIGIVVATWSKYVNMNEIYNSFVFHQPMWNSVVWFGRLNWKQYLLML